MGFSFPSNKQANVANKPWHNIVSHMVGLLDWCRNAKAFLQEEEEFITVFIHILNQKWKYKKRRWMQAFRQMANFHITLRQIPNNACNLNICYSFIECNINILIAFNQILFTNGNSQIANEYGPFSLHFFGFCNMAVSRHHPHNVGCVQLYTFKVMRNSRELSSSPNAITIITMKEKISRLFDLLWLWCF